MTKKTSLRLLRWLREFVLSLGWVAAALTFSGVSIAAVIGLAWLFQLAFPFLPDFSVAFALLLAFIVYLAAVGWIGWKIIKRRLRL